MFNVGHGQSLPDGIQSYNIRGVEYRFKEKPGRLQVRLKPSSSALTVRARLSGLSAKTGSGVTSVRQTQKQMTQEGDVKRLDLEVVNAGNLTVGKAEVDGLVSQLRSQADVEEVYPVYEVNGEEVWVTSEMLLAVSGRLSTLPSNVQREVDLRGGRVTAVHDLGDYTTFEIDYPANHDVFASARELNATLAVSSKQERGFLYTTPNFEFLVHQPVLSAHTPNDPSLATQRFLSQPNNRDINAPEAWGLTQGSNTVTVAVFDDGFDPDHSDLDTKYFMQYNAAVDNMSITPDANAHHGTATAGLVGAATNNGRGVASIGYNIRVMPVKIASMTPMPGTFLTSVTIMVRAFTHVVTNGATVVAVSNSIGLNSIKTDQNIIDGYDQMRRNCRGGKGAVICASSGNSSTELFGIDGSAPYIYPEVFGIGATGDDDAKASFSNYGDSLDVVAPGTTGPANNPFVYTTDRNGPTGYSTDDYTTFSGTSASCPIVAGIIGLVASVKPNLTERELRGIVASSSTKVFGAANFPLTKVFGSWNNELGYGRVDAFAAVSAAIALSSEEERAGSLSKKLQVTPNPASQQVRVAGELPGSPGSLFYTVVDASGRAHKVGSSRVANEVNFLINIADLAPGIYTLYASFGNERGQWKIVKQ